MQSYIVFALVAFAAVVAAQEYYPSTYDDVDLEAIVNSDRLFMRYEMCILEPNPRGCTKDAEHLRKILPEVLENLCAKCTETQKAKIKQLLTYICKKRPEAFARILAKIDPEGKYRSKFEEKFGTIEGGC